MASHNVTSYVTSQLDITYHNMTSHGMSQRDITAWHHMARHNVTSYVTSQLDITYHNMTSHGMSQRDITCHITTWHHMAHHNVTSYVTSQLDITYHNMTSHGTSQRDIICHITTWHHMACHNMTSHITTWHHMACHNMTSHITTWHHMACHNMISHGMSQHDKTQLDTTCQWSPYICWSEKYHNFFPFSSFSLEKAWRELIKQGGVVNGIFYWLKNTLIRNKEIYQDLYHLQIKPNWTTVHISITITAFTHFVKESYYSYMETGIIKITCHFLVLITIHDSTCKPEVNVN